MKRFLFLTALILAGCDGDRPDPSSVLTPADMQQNIRNSHSWLNGYSTVILQRPQNDFAHSLDPIGRRIMQNNFEVLLPEAWPTLSADVKKRCLVFTYSYEFADDVSITGMFTDATTGHVVHQWSSTCGRWPGLQGLIRCLDDGMIVFRERTGYDETATASRPLSWQ